MRRIITLMGGGTVNVEWQPDRILQLTKRRNEKCGTCICHIINERTRESDWTWQHVEAVRPWRFGLRGRAVKQCTLQVFVIDPAS